MRYLPDSSAEPTGWRSHKPGAILVRMARLRSPELETRVPHLSSMPFHISDAWKSGERIVDSAIRLLPNVILGIVIFILFLLIGSFTKWLIRRAAERHNVSRVGLALLLGRVGQLVMIVLGILIALAIAAPSFNTKNIVQMLGIGTVAIGFAFQNILQNFLAGILLLLNEPFHLGDTISVSGMEGRVEDIEARATIITSKEGNKVVIPNATVFMNPVTVQHRSTQDQGRDNQNPPQDGEKSSGDAKNPADQNKQQTQESEEEHMEAGSGTKRRGPHFFSW